MAFWTRKRVSAAFGAIAVTASLAVGATAYADVDPVYTQVLSISDFHRQLAPPEPDKGGVITGDNGEKITAGGAAYLATHLEKLQENSGDSILMSAGDSFAGDAFESSVHAEEPTIEALNTLGLDFSTVGNHELDWGSDYLIDHLQNGECVGEEGVDSCFADSKGEKYHGADYDYYTGNVFAKDAEEPILPPYTIEQVAGPDGKKIPVGVINSTTHETETMPASYNPDLTTRGTVETVNKYAEELTSQGVKAIVANVHEGAKPAAGADHPLNGCEDVAGDVIESAKKISPAVDAIVGGHEHKNFNCQVPDPDGDLRSVVEPGPFGTVVNEMNLALDPGSGEVLRDETTTKNIPVTRDVTPDESMQKVVDFWVQAGKDRAATEHGKISQDVTKDKTGSGESTLGNWAADINLWASERTDDAKADLGLVMTDPHGDASNALGDDLKVAAGDQPGDAEGLVTFKEAYDSYGYGDPILTVTLTGEQLEAALEQQWTDEKFAPVAVSQNVSYSYDDTKPIGQRVEPGDVKINGEALDSSKEYRVATESYTALGEDGLPALADFSQPVRVGDDHKLVMDYVEELGVVTAPDTGRVTKK